MVDNHAWDLITLVKDIILMVGRSNPIVRDILLTLPNVGSDEVQSPHLRWHA